MKGQSTAEYILVVFVFITVVVFLYLSVFSTFPGAMSDVKRQTACLRADMLTSTLLKSKGIPDNWELNTITGGQIYADDIGFSTGQLYYLNYSKWQATKNLTYGQYILSTNKSIPFRILYTINSFDWAQDSLPSSSVENTTPNVYIMRDSANNNLTLMAGTNGIPMEVELDILFPLDTITVDSNDSYITYISGNSTGIKVDWDLDNSNISQCVYPTSMTYYWMFDDGSGTTGVDSVDANDQKLCRFVNDGDACNQVSGLPVWGIGLINGSLSFDGVDDYSVSSMASPPALSIPYSIEFWFKYRESASDNGWSVLVHRGGSQYCVYEPYIAISEYNGTLRAATSGCGPNQNITTNATIIPGKWHHVAVTVSDAPYDNRIYIDGELVGTSTATPCPDAGGWCIRPDLTKQFHIGALYTGGACDDYRYFSNTTVDEFAYYTRVLSPEEISDHYDSRTHFCGVRKYLNLTVSRGTERVYIKDADCVSERGADCNMTIGSIIDLKDDFGGLGFEEPETICSAHRHGVMDVSGEVFGLDLEVEVK